MLCRGVSVNGASSNIALAAQRWPEPRRRAAARDPRAPAPTPGPRPGALIYWGTILNLQLSALAFHWQLGGPSLTRSPSQDSELQVVELEPLMHEKSLPVRPGATPAQEDSDDGARRVTGGPRAAPDSLRLPRLRVKCPPGPVPLAVPLPVAVARGSDSEWSGQVRFITRPKSRTMRAKRNKRSRANRTNVPK